MAKHGGKRRHSSRHAVFCILRMEFVALLMRCSCHGGWLSAAFVSHKCNGMDSG